LFKTLWGLGCALQTDAHDTWGSKMNQCDAHKVGFDFDFLNWHVTQVGFRECQRVMEFNIFNDSSSLRVLGNLISLNVFAT
jgi:hypothetical protein